MTEYNRYTTDKGNLLLNINPPNPYQTKQHQSNNTNHIYHSVTNQNTNNIPANPYQIHTDTLNNSNGGYGHISEPKVIRESKENKLNSARYFEEGRQTQNMSEKRAVERNIQNKEETNVTKCCFPGFWLLILVLAVVVATFFIFFLKNQGISEHKVDKNGNKSANNNEKSFSSVSETELSSNSTETLSTSTESKENLQIKPISILPIQVETKPNVSLSEGEEGGSKTSFQFPAEEKPISPFEEENGGDEIKSIPIIENKYETSYMIPKVQNHRHFLRANILH